MFAPHARPQQAREAARGPDEAERRRARQPCLAVPEEFVDDESTFDSGVFEPFPRRGLRRRARNHRRGHGIETDLTSRVAAPLPDSLQPAVPPSGEILVPAFTFEFFRIRPGDKARAMLGRVAYIMADLDAAKVKARSMFETLSMPQEPDGLRILDEAGCEVFEWHATGGGERTVPT